MTIKTVGYSILIKPDEVEETTDWGFELNVDKDRERGALTTGIVISVGSHAWKAHSKDYDGEPWAKVGDHVCFAKYAGRFVTDPKTGEEFMMMNDEDIKAIIEE